MWRRAVWYKSPDVSKEQNYPHLLNKQKMVTCLAYSSFYGSMATRLRTGWATEQLRFDFWKR
jgi:hypothetical protein